MVKVVICSSGSIDKHISGVGANIAILNGVIDGEYLIDYDGVAIPLKPHNRVSNPPHYDRIWISLSGENGEYTDRQCNCLDDILTNLRLIYNCIGIHRAEEFFDNEKSISEDYLHKLKNKFE